LSIWPSTKANRVLKALLKIGWYVVSQRGSYIKLKHPRFPNAYTWAFHDNEEIGPKMLSRIAKHTGLTPLDL
jgi:predicted RNA binding protein YcfA (HicA-like mRNA interferase family)